MGDWGLWLELGWYQCINFMVMGTQRFNSLTLCLLGRAINDENDDEDENVPLYYHINRDFSIPFGERRGITPSTGLRSDILVILGVESRRVVPNWMLRLENDKVAWDKYPWGSYVWPTLYFQLRNANVKRWSPLYVAEPTNEDDAKTYSIFGYTWAFKVNKARACPCGAEDVVLRESYKPKTHGKLYYACPRLKPRENTFGCKKNLWKEERARLLVGSPRASTTPIYSPGFSSTPIYSPGSSTPPRYSPGASTPQIYSPGTSRNAVCSNCKHLLDKITVLEATVDMYMHPEEHTVNSAALFHEVYNNMRKLDLE
ncbi:hypothetical protein Tco_1182153 [Tanacetum coccineum]